MSSPPSKLPRFVLFGDSLTEWSFDEHTEGFGWVLQQIYEGKVDVVNEGFAGYTSRAVQPEFSRIIASASRQDAAPVLLFTIFLGANDACYVGDGEYVPLASFEANLRRFVDDILAHDGLHAAKIVLITPPPINIPDPAPESDDGDGDDDDDAQLTPAAREALASARQDPKKERGYRTYMNKKRYADRVMDMGAEYKQTGRVVGLNYWKALVDAALDDQKRLGDEHQYDEERLPGCGLRGAKAFKRGYFTDGLHLDKLGYNVLSKALLDIVCQTWPELRPERIGT